MRWRNGYWWACVYQEKLTRLCIITDVGEVIEALAGIRLPEMQIKYIRLLVPVSACSLK